MKTTDLFTKVGSKQINETLQKTFGQKLNLESYSLTQLEDARNRLRTQLHQYKQSANFNETVEGDAYTKAQWMGGEVHGENRWGNQFFQLPMMRRSPLTTISAHRSKLFGLLVGLVET